MNQDAKNDVTALVTTAVNDGKDLLRGAKGSLETLIKGAGTDAQGLVVQAEETVIKVALDFVPSAYRGIVQGLVLAAASKAEGAVNQTIDAEIQKVVGVAIARIDAVLK